MDRLCPQGQEGKKVDINDPFTCIHSGKLTRIRETYLWYGDALFAIWPIHVELRQLSMIDSDACAVHTLQKG